MKRTKGFTLIELMICIAIIAILASIVIPAATGLGGKGKNSHTTGHFGLNGYTEVSCIDGYKFVVGERGNARQVMDEYGHGVRCGYQ